MLELNKENYKEVTSIGNVVVDFWAPWCAPCRALMPILESINEVTVAKVNCDQQEDLANAYEISSIPCLLLYKDGKQIGRMLGIRSKEEILQVFKENQ